MIHKSNILSWKQQVSNEQKQQHNTSPLLCGWHHHACIYIPFTLFYNILTKQKRYWNPSLQIAIERPISFQIDVVTRSFSLTMG
uniref:Uncharacterized protein n=1 Tax=Arundo donax TaxID=35708 RepID=A0A0A9DNL7_ARUDO